MKNFMLLIFFLGFFVSCYTPQGAKNPVEDVADQSEETPNPEPISVPVDYSKDPRLSVFDAESVEWINYPASTSSRAVKKDIDIMSKCNKPSWNYMFYDDEAVIGYEPPEGNYSVMLNAIKITVESHNMEFPEKKWDYHTVAPPAPPPPDTSHDPVLGIWQACLCLDDGTVVAGIYTAEFDFNWAGYKSSLPAELEVYNRDHDPDAHIVWGLEKP